MAEIDFEYCACSGTGPKSSSLAFYFLREETQDYYKWALQNLLNIFTSHEIPLPEVVITDQEQAQINSLSYIFPNAYQMLCIWNIKKNLNNNGTKYIKNKTSEHAMIKNGIISSVYLLHQM